ncbi:MAG TPA: YfhO family protein [Pyrinomonadaceae bacterium]|nr:YfhO family protein [Pyrinomonadaceae bacterium]
MDSRGRGADAAAMLCIACFFVLFFGWILFGDKYVVGGDAFAYSYPLRTVAWEMIRNGQLPLWTPYALSGYPLLSMSQLGLAYPLTWGYLFLDAPRAEQIYVLAPFLLSPMFTYAYARELGRSRTAALLAGLSYAYGGATTGLLGVVGFHTNAMMWLPLILIPVERVRTSRRFASCLAAAACAYALSVLTGYAQGFVFNALVAVSYAIFLSLFVDSRGEGSRVEGWLSWRRWRPALVALGAIALGAGVGAFQILETMRAVRRSIRRTLIYPFFVSGSFSPRVALKSLAAPLYTERFADVGTYVAPVVLLLAVAAVIFALRRTTATTTRDARVFFWAGASLVSCVLILGKYTPVYGLLYHVPVFNSFRVPSRFSFVWTFAASVLAAYGWDALAGNVRERMAIVGVQPSSLRSFYFYAVLAAFLGFRWWRQARDFAITDLDAATGVPRAWVDGFWYAGLPVSTYLSWKLAFTLLTLLLVLLGWKLDASRARRIALTIVVALVCFVEPFIVVSNWWQPFAKSRARFHAASPVTRFLQARQAEETQTPHSRIYTRVNLFAEEFTESPRFDPPNLTALYELENVGGYEPLLLERYSRALGNVHLDASSPIPGFPPNRAVFDARSHILDLLGARFVVNANMEAKTNAQTVERDGVRFDAADLATELQAGEKIVLNTNVPVRCDTLALVTFMSNSVEVEDGTIVALVRLYTADGYTIERPLRAGSDTAEWAHERADVRANIRHKLAPVFDSAPVKDEQGAYPSNRYLARIRLGDPVEVVRVEITNATERVPLALWKATLYDATRKLSQPLTRTTQRDLYASLDAARWSVAYDADDVLVLENRRALPRAWLVGEAEAVDGEEALRRIGGESAHAFDPRRTALMEVAPSELPALAGVELTTGNSAARIVSYEPNRIAIETRAAQPSVLVVGEIFYPGWEATVDGQPARIHLTDYILRGVALPAGEHRVEMRYRATAARNGAFISALTLVVLCALAIYGRAKPTREDETERGASLEREDSQHE